jgi:hypothetical protein
MPNASTFTYSSILTASYHAGFYDRKWLNIRGFKAIALSSVVGFWYWKLCLFAPEEIKKKNSLFQIF